MTVERLTADFLALLAKAHPKPVLNGPSPEEMWAYARALGQHELVQDWLEILKREQKEPIA